LYLLLVPAVFFILPQLIESAIQAQSIMTAYHFATFRTAPFFLFLFQKTFDAMLFDEFEVFYHAHMVPGAVSFIEAFQSTTGKFFALIAKPNQPFPEQITMFFHKGTVLTAWPTATAVSLSKSLLLKVIFHRQITNTESAVHATGSDK